LAINITGVRRTPCHLGGLSMTSSSPRAAARRRRSVPRALRTALAVAGVSGAAALAVAPAAMAHQRPTAATAKASCKGISFTVLHNDSSGGVTLPKGKYTVSSPNLGCKPASNLFTKFLNKYNHAIPGWKGKQIAKGWGTYTKNKSKTKFTVKWSKAKKKM
jgi:hypothetical protein